MAGLTLTKETEIGPIQLNASETADWMVAFSPNQLRKPLREDIVRLMDEWIGKSGKYSKDFCQVLNAVGVELESRSYLREAALAHSLTVRYETPYSFPQAPLYSVKLLRAMNEHLNSRGTTPAALVPEREWMGVLGEDLLQAWRCVDHFYKFTYYNELFSRWEKAPNEPITQFDFAYGTRKIVDDCYSMIPVGEGLIRIYNFLISGK